jgi:hypothetical protein
VTDAAMVAGAGRQVAAGHCSFESEWIIRQFRIDLVPPVPAAKVVALFFGDSV